MPTYCRNLGGSQSRSFAMILNSRAPLRPLPKILGLAALLSVVLWVKTAAADEAPAKASTEQREIDALTRQLKAVQTELKEVAEQNQLLLKKQAQVEQLEQDLERQVANLAQPAAPSASN